jgi:hypothetical protein
MTGGGTCRPPEVAHLGGRSHSHAENFFARMNISAKTIKRPRNRRISALRGDIFLALKSPFKFKEKSKVDHMAHGGRRANSGRKLDPLPGDPRTAAIIVSAMFRKGRRGNVAALLWLLRRTDQVLAERDRVASEPPEGRA